MNKDKNLNKYISASLVLGLILPFALPNLETKYNLNSGLFFNEMNLQADENSDKNSVIQTELDTEQVDAKKVDTENENATEFSGEGENKELSKEAAQNDNATDSEQNVADTSSEELEVPENDDAVISKSASLGKMSQEEAGKDMQLIAENDAAVLFFSSKNSLVRLYNKNKKLVFDNKVIDGQKGNRLTKNLQKSDFQLTFLKELRTLGVQSENNNEMSIELEQFDFEKIENGLKINFVLGQQGLSADDMPIAIPSEKMAKVLKKLKKKERKQLLRIYREFKDRYMRSTNQSMSALQLKLYYGLLYEKGGYTKDDLEADNAQYASGEEKKSSNLKIELAMEYLLDGEDLLVKVPLSEIKINPDKYLPYRLRLLPYAMIGSELDNGYFVIPDGNGAIVKFNNDRKESANYSKRMYGEDLLYDKDKKRKLNNLKFPVFGMKRDDQGVLLILEDGKDLADVTVEISGKADEFNKLGIEYRLIDVDQVKTVGSSNVTQNKYPERLYTGDIVQRYRILDENESNWLQMARIYSDYLQMKGALPKRHSDVGSKKLSEPSAINTNLSFFGIVPKRKFFLGVPYMSNQVMTSYLEASDILRDLQNAIEQNDEFDAEKVRLSASYLAEADSGLFLDRKNANLLSAKLGNRSQSTELKNLIEKLGGDLTTVINATEVSSLRAFKKATEISRALSGEYASENLYDSIHQSSKDTSKVAWFISPRFLATYVKDLINRFNSEGRNNLSLLGLGEVIVPDYKRGENILRHEAMEMEHKLIEEITSENSDRRISLNNPADYALVSSENYNIKNIVCEADPYRVFNYTVPFVSSIYRDRLDTELESFDPNSYMSLKKYLLYSLESGAVPNFLLTYKNALILENSDYEGLLGSEYALRKDDILTTIKARNDYLTYVAASSLIDEKIYADGSLRSLEFANGQVMWLNFSEEKVLLADKEIEGLGYLFIEKSDCDKVFEGAENLEKRHQEEEEMKDKAEEEAKEASAKSSETTSEIKSDKNISEANQEKDAGLDIKDKEKSESKTDKKSKRNADTSTKEKSTNKSEENYPAKPEARKDAKTSAPKNTKGRKDVSRK